MRVNAKEFTSMKPYFAKSGAWVQFETLFPSGYHMVTLYDPDDNVLDRVRCDDIVDLCAYRCMFVAIANNWGK